MECDHRESEDINALVQARYTSFNGENSDYPDFSNMRIKGVRAACVVGESSCRRGGRHSLTPAIAAIASNEQKLPQPRETRASQGKDVRLHSGRYEPDDPEHLFKMSKFKKVGSVLCTQPIKSGDGGDGAGYYPDDRY